MLTNLSDRLLRHLQGVSAVRVLHCDLLDSEHIDLAAHVIEEAKAYIACMHPAFDDQSGHDSYDDISEATARSRKAGQQKERLLDSLRRCEANGIVVEVSRLVVRTPGLFGGSSGTLNAVFAFYLDANSSRRFPIRVPGEQSGHNCLALGGRQSWGGNASLNSSIRQRKPGTSPAFSVETLT